MPPAEKTQHRDPDQTPADPFAWDPDPLVLVSRRNRALYFPGALLRGEATPEQVKAWTNPEALSTSRDEKHLALFAGVNFLGAFTSSWLYRQHDGRSAPQGAPPLDMRVLLFPDTNGRDVLMRPSTGIVDRDTNRLRPDKIRETIGRVLDYHRKHLSHGDDNLWAADDGFEAPELVLMSLSQVFSQAGPAAADAHTTAVQSIRFLRRTRESAAIIGALHDYAIRSRSGAAIVAECRQWWARKKLG